MQNIPSSKIVTVINIWCFSLLEKVKRGMLYATIRILFQLDTARSQGEYTIPPQRNSLRRMHISEACV